MKCKERQNWKSKLKFRLGVRDPSGTRDQFFFLHEIFFRQLRVCYFVAPSLTTGRVCNLQFLLVLASAVPLGSESRGTRTPYFIVPILETPPTWRARSPYLYPPGTGWPRYTLGHCVPFPSPLTTRRATVEVSSKQHIKIQYVPQREHVKPPLQRQLVNTT
jgi:hypothetical protein